MLSGTLHYIFSMDQAQIIFRANNSQLHTAYLLEQRAWRSCEVVEYFTYKQVT
jgi:hypothetical protein